LPFVFTDTYSRHVLIMIFAYAIVASNWDLSLGYGGVFNFAIWRCSASASTPRGISLVRQRMITLAASAFFTGIAGAFYAAYQRNASTDVFGMSIATIILSMVLLGGAGTIYGAIGASFVLTIFSEAMADFGAWRPMITAVLIIGIMLAYPSGLVGLIQASWNALQRQDETLSRFCRKTVEDFSESCLPQPESRSLPGRATLFPAWERGWPDAMYEGDPRIAAALPGQRMPHQLITAAAMTLVDSTRESMSTNSSTPWNPSPDGP
jgi:hypothetical protein